MAGHIIAILGGKGGVGKSIFTANFALSYLQNFKQRPLIIDCDFQSLGDQNLILGQTSAKNVVDASKMAPGPLDPKTLAPYIVNAPQGYSFMSSPKDHLAARDMDLEGFGRLLKGVTQVFSTVFIDCGSSLEPHVFKVLEFCTAIFVVTTPDVIVLNQTKRILSKLQENLFPNEMVQVIINRVHAGQLLTPPAVQKNLNRTVFAVIPEDAASSEASLSKSVPLVLASPQSVASRAYQEAARKLGQTNLLEILAKLKKPSGVAQKAATALTASSSAGKGNGVGASATGPQDPWTLMKLRILTSLIDELDLKRADMNSQDHTQKAIVREKAQKTVTDILSREDTQSLLTTKELKMQMIKEVLDESLGLGPLEDLLKDDSVSEIMVNARDQIYVERNGKPGLSPVVFSSEALMMNIITRIVTPLGRQINDTNPYVDARLPDGSRVHVIIPPLALRGPTITIRKFPKKRVTHKDLIQFGSMTEEIADFLRCCVEGKLNIVVSGGTGSGKTTLLNVLSNFIPASERIITVEDSAELQLGQDHVVRLETKPKNNEGKGEVSIRDLIKCCLRMRPDRIVVGECRGGEALDMLQAMNTGHSGSLTTLHANNPRECISRLETLVMMSGLQLPSKAIKENIASAVNLIIQQSRLPDGSRKVTHISEVTGMQGDVISIQDIFTFKQEKLDKNRKILGRFVSSGFVPSFVKEMEAKGMRIPMGLFKTG